MPHLLSLNLLRCQLPKEERTKSYPCNTSPRPLFQASLIIFLASLSLAHHASNRKLSLGSLNMSLGFLPRVSNIIASWSKWASRSTSDERKGQSLSHPRDATNLSSLSLTSPHPLRLFVQVNQPLSGFTSTNVISSRVFQKSSITTRALRLHPYFFESSNILLKSPL